MNHRYAGIRIWNRLYTSGCSCGLTLYGRTEAELYDRMTAHVIHAGRRALTNAAPAHRGPSC